MIGFQRGINLIFSLFIEGIILCFIHFVKKTIYLNRQNLYINYNF